MLTYYIFLIKKGLKKMFEQSFYNGAYLVGKCIINLLIITKIYEIVQTIFLVCRVLCLFQSQLYSLL